MTAAIAQLTDARVAIVIAAWVVLPAIVMWSRSKRNPKR